MPRRKPTRRSTNSRGAIQREKQDHSPAELSEELLARPAPEVLIVDDLVDTGATAKIVRALLPGAHFATVYAKSEGLPQVDTYVHGVAQETWIYFPWDTALSFQEPISARRKG